MNKKLLIYILATSTFLVSFSFLTNYQSKKTANLSSLPSSIQIQNIASDIDEEEKTMIKSAMIARRQSFLENKSNEQPSTNTVALAPKPDIETQQSISKKPTLSRGGSIPTNTPNTTQSNKIELVDWWQEGRTIFAIGSIADVTDVYTGKTFKAKRTMGINHADSEALTKDDTNIIKSIWGGFSWDRRPIILTINGKKYAASMSAMPHAGLDSAPLNAIVNNRSGDFGRGENLDAIKGNGMDGHFDIHFLNSTRHFDNQKDPQHQAAVLKAANR